MKEWTKRWLAKRRKPKPLAKRRKPKPPQVKWTWPKVQYKELNQWLNPELKAMTSNRCSFCDSTVQPASPRTVEHFLAKTVKPCAAFHWPNLYYCCMGCQLVKKERTDRRAVRPDEAGYRFEAYFRYKPDTGYLRLAPLAPREAKIRALATIRLYRLNRMDLREARVQALQVVPEDPGLDVSLRAHQYLRRFKSVSPDFHA